jgi:putative serine protease PepD
MSDVPPQYPGLPYYPEQPQGGYPAYPQSAYDWTAPQPGPPVPGAPAGPPPPPGEPSPVNAAQDPSASRRTSLLVTAIVAALIGGGIGAGTVALLGRRTTTVNVGLALSSQAAPAPKLDGSISAAAAKIQPSVVTIDVRSSSEADTGSGVIIRQDGYILTNNHVVANAANAGGSIVVTLADGRRAAASIVGTDKSDDLAVVRVRLTGLTAATFASSSGLVVGQTVVAVGAPLGLSDTVTSGIVSSTARPVSTGDSQSSLAVFDAVQTDAAINPGNSGGPLVDLNGSVVGINAAIATDQSQGGLQIPGQSSQSGNIGIGFAIPSDEASRIAGELIATGKASHALLGVTVRDAVTSASAGAPVGAVVSSVKAGSPAARAGLKTGDLVTLLAGQRIDSADALVAAVRSHAPNQTVAISYLRAGSTHTIQVKLVASAS